MIDTLKPKKSAGFDNISNFMIKRLPPGYLTCLSKCFNEWLEQGITIDDWKVAKIITLNKVKSSTPQCDQTRPISLLATHSKLYEKILLKRIKNWAESNQIIPKEQSGFRKGCLLQTRVLSIYQEVKNYLAANVPTLSIYVDYRKAYDMVWHQGLITKLFHMEMPLELLKLVLNWLSNRQAYVEFGNCKSEKFNINVGLPQGSSLSPYIFIIFHSDIVHCTGACSTHIFADDLCALVVPPIGKSLAKMVEYINRKVTEICKNLYDYSLKWKQPINVKKTVVQLFHTQVDTPEVQVFMGGKELECVKKFKYLGF
jgi:hypothetical protein